MTSLSLLKPLSQRARDSRSGLPRRMRTASTCNYPEPHVSPLISPPARPLFGGSSSKRLQEVNPQATGGLWARSFSRPARLAGKGRGFWEQFEGKGRWFLWVSFLGFHALACGFRRFPAHFAPPKISSGDIPTASSSLRTGTLPGKHGAYLGKDPICQLSAVAKREKGTVSLTKPGFLD